MKTKAELFICFLKSQERGSKTKLSITTLFFYIRLMFCYGLSHSENSIRSYSYILSTRALVFLPRSKYQARRLLLSVE